MYSCVRTCERVGLSVSILMYVCTCECVGLSESVLVCTYGSEHECTCVYVRVNMWV